MTVNQVIKNILSDISLLSMSLDINDYPLPEPYCPKDRTKIKAFVLGADPSNFSDEGKTRKISVVFDIGRDKRYFNAVNQNLKYIGLSIDNVYVQNLVRNYTTKETTSNPFWDSFAEKWLPYIKEEFDSVDPEKKLPILVTAEVILKFLLLQECEPGLASEYYNGQRNVPIVPSLNKLERNLFPFYRHTFYSLKNQENYKEELIKSFKLI